jgi:hypothetical protein
MADLPLTSQGACIAQRKVVLDVAIVRGTKYRRAERVEDRLMYLEEQMDLIAGLMNRL